MMTLFWIYFCLYCCLEYYEIFWQKADSMMGMLLRMHRYYGQNIFLFLIMHPTYYFLIFLIIDLG